MRKKITEWLIKKLGGYRLIIVAHDLKRNSTTRYKAWIISNADWYQFNVNRQTYVCYNPNTNEIKVVSKA